MTLALILNLTVVTALLVLLTATLRLPYRLHAASRVRRAQPEPEMT
jgi:hypothetical protein